jgi:hypothetical protein
MYWTVLQTVPIMFFEIQPFLLEGDRSKPYPDGICDASRLGISPDVTELNDIIAFGYFQ